MAKQVLISLFLLFLCSVQCARILGIFQIPSISHQVVFQAIWKELSLRGHNVTVITTDPLNDQSLTNLTEIDVGPPLYARIENISSVLATKPNHWLLNAIFFLRSDKHAEIVFGNSQVSALINDSSQKFDVVLSEYATPLGSMFAAKYKCPLVAISSTLLFSPVLRSLGVPTHPVLYHDMMTPYGDHFFDRVKSLLYSIFSQLLHSFVVIPKFDSIMKENLGADLPYFGDIEKNASVVLLTTNPIMHGPRPFGPNIIPISKLHIKPPKPLPKELQEYLDKSDKVVYFSLGSNVKSAYLNKEKIQTILKVFSQLPYKFLWKYEKDDLKDVPSNVIISKWFSQQDILRHPNVKLFITQAGLQSAEEGIVNKVPMLTVPFIFDQFQNARRIVNLGIDETLDFDDLTEDSFKDSIAKIIENPRYKEAISEVSELFTDEPMESLEKAMFWIEYVIKHRDTKYLRSPAADVTWFSFLMIDVLAFLFVISFGLALIGYKILLYIFHIRRNKLATKKIKKK